MRKIYLKSVSRVSLLIVSFLASCSINAEDFYPYAAVGIGYKFDEPSYVEYGGKRLDVSFGSKDSALIEAGFEYGKNISFGLKHDSQWSTGCPVNNEPEYSKTEIFIRYKIGGRP